MTTDSGPRGKAAQLRAEAAAHAAEVERLSSEAELWDRGADGEDEVQELLEAGLPAGEGWHVVRNVVISPSGTDIDHVVVGPAGVFTINTKHHPGKRIWVSPVKFLVDGRPQDYLIKSGREAERAQQRLGTACGSAVHVRSVIVVVGAASFTVVEQPVQPRVEAAADVVAWLHSLPSVLSAEQASIIAGAVSDPATWNRQSALRQSSPARRPRYRSTTEKRPRRRRTAVRRSSWAAPVAAVVLLAIVFAVLRHHPNVSDGLSGSTTTTSTSLASTTAPATFQAVGTVTNGQCVDAWSNHGVEVQVSGAGAGSDCIAIASPGNVATETSSAAGFGALMGGYGRATIGSGLEPVCSSTLASGDRITVYDQGGQAFGHAFCSAYA